MSEKLYNQKGTGKLDSLGLLNLIVAVEESIQNKCNATISLMEEQSDLHNQNPFNSIGSLIEHVDRILKEGFK